MAFSKQPDPMETRMAYWRRVLRPLFWWCLLVLGLYGIRLHQRWNAETHLRFSASVPGQSAFSETIAEVDGRPYFSGQQLNMGKHKLVVTQQNGYPFSTNMFVWYGPHDLGNIILERTKGTLAVSCSPPATRLIIRGTEFSTTLTNSSGFNSRVPTGNYQVEAIYDHWRGADKATITTDAMASKSFAPRLGSVAITGSHPDIRFELRNLDGELMAAGQVPMIITGLPEDSHYKLTAERKADQKIQAVAVRYGMTNDLQIEYTYGSVTILSKPAGASVYYAGEVIGSTPLTLNEVRTGNFAFSLTRTEYESVSAELLVIARQTNIFSTNLISEHFTRAMASARQSFANGNFGRSVESVTEALKYNPDDIEATNLLHKATLRDHLAKAENLNARADFVGAMNEANLALAMEPDNAKTKDALASYTAKEQQRLEVERIRLEKEAADNRARERTKELWDEFNSACRAYENAPIFANNELVATNVMGLSKRIVDGLTASQPAFENVRLDYIQTHLFMVRCRQRIGLGYRDCLIMGSFIRDNQIQVRFKVFEYEHMPQVNLLGGLVQVNASLAPATQDPQYAAEQAQRFQQRVIAGIKQVKGIIQQADQP